jgi:hypothetical protein
MDAPTKPWALRRAGQLLVDQLNPRAEPEVPRSPDHVDRDWLTRVLCANEPGVRVASVKRLDGGKGTTTRRSLELAYHGTATTELPSRLFVKCTSSLAQRLMLGLGGLIEGEPGFYNHVRPGLEIEAPTGYFAAVDPRSWHSVVLLEDVTATKHARFWGPNARTTPTQIENLLSQVAKWHAALWNSPRLTEWSWLKTPAEQMRVIDALLALADRRRAGLRRAREVLPPTLRRRHGDLLAAMRRSMALTSQGPQTYLHGDLHIANTYLTGDGRMGIADWQVGLRGSWAFDVAYLLASSLEIGDRRACERGLLSFYIEQLARAGGDRIPEPAAWECYRQATFYPYFAWLYTLGRSRLQPNFQPAEVSLLMVERIAAAIEDLDSFAAVGL